MSTRGKYGHLPKEKLIGTKFGRLLVISCAPKGPKYTGYWCLCDCGSEVWQPRTRLVSGNTRSCGCLRREVCHLNADKSLHDDPQRAAKTRLFNTYRSSAKKRGYEFKIDFSDFIKLTSMECHYCGVEPLKIQKSWSGANPNYYLYNGLDRVDNNIDYYIDNVVPCCETCNKAKRLMTVDEFLIWIERVYKYKCMKR